MLMGTWSPCLTRQQFFSSPPLKYLEYAILYRNDFSAHHVCTIVARRYYNRSRCARMRISYALVMDNIFRKPTIGYIDVEISNVNGFDKSKE